MKNYMPLNGLRWSRDSGSANCDMLQSDVLGRPGGGKINVCHNACLLISNKIFAMAKLHLFFVNNLNSATL